MIIKDGKIVASIIDVDIKLYLPKKRFEESNNITKFWLGSENTCCIGSDGNNSTLLRIISNHFITEEIAIKEKDQELTLGAIKGIKCAYIAYRTFVKEFEIVDHIFMFNNIDKNNISEKILKDKDIFKEYGIAMYGVNFERVANETSQKEN